MGITWSLSAAPDAKEPALDAAPPDQLRALSSDPDSMLNPRANLGFICNDVIDCIHHYTSAPCLVAMTWVNNFQQTNRPTYGLSAFDMGAAVDEQQWSHYAFDFAHPHPQYCHITPYNYHTLAMVPSAAVEPTRYFPSNPTYRHTNPPFLWACSTRKATAALPQQKSIRRRTGAITIGDSLVVYGGAIGEAETCDALRDDTWATATISDMPPVQNFTCANLPTRASAVVFTPPKTAWIIDFTQLRATNHNYYFMAASYAPDNCLVSTAVLDRNDTDVYTWHPKMCLLSRYDTRLDKLADSNPMPIKMALPSPQSAVALDTNCIAILGTSETEKTAPEGEFVPYGPGMHIYKEGGLPKAQPDCWVYDVRADAWRRELRWATDACALKIIKL